MKDVHYCPSFFAVVMQPFAQSVRKNPNIKKINIGQEEHKLALFVDNVMLIIIKPINILCELQ